MSVQTRCNERLRVQGSQRLRVWVWGDRNEWLRALGRSRRSERLRAQDRHDQPMLARLQGRCSAPLRVLRPRNRPLERVPVRRRPAQHRLALDTWAQRSPRLPRWGLRIRRFRRASYTWRRG